MKATSLVLSVAVLACVPASPASAEPDQAAWLGCRIMPVPKSLDAHLGLSGNGTMVINIAKGSPADKAGLERYDVVVQLGPKRIASPGDLSGGVAKLSPGQKTTLRIFHKGKEKSVELVLAKRPDVGGQEFKYERMPDALFDDRLGVSGRILRRGPKGWIIEDLDEIEGLPRLFHRDLPNGHFPKGFREQRRYWKQNGDDPVKKFQARVTRDGRVIVVEGEADGRVKVRHTDDKGNTVEREYDSPGDLKKADPEAYTIYLHATGKDECKRTPGRKSDAKRRKIRPTDPVDRHNKWLRDLFDRMPSYRDILSEERAKKLEDLYGKKSEELSRKLEKQLEAAHKRIVESEKQLEKRLEELRRSYAPRPDGQAPTAPSSDPTTRFEVSSDGKITVHVRKGDSELMLPFANVGELKTKRPDLYEKYEALIKKP